MADLSAFDRLPRGGDDVWSLGTPAGTILNGEAFDPFSVAGTQSIAVTSGGTATLTSMGPSVDGAQTVDQGTTRGERSNFLLQSNTFSSSSWTKDNVSVTGGQSDPFGGSNAWKLNETAVTNQFRLRQQTTATLPNKSHIVSLWMKQGEKRYVRLQVIDQSAADGAQVYVDLQTGSITLENSFGNGGSFDAGIENAGSGWYRVWVTASPVETTTDGTATRFSLNILNTENGGSTFAGTAGSGIYIYGAQLDLGNLLGDYIDTTTAAVHVAGATVTAASGVAVDGAQTVDQPGSTATAGTTRGVSGSQAAPGVTQSATITVPRSVAGSQSVSPPASTATAGTTRGVQGSQSAPAVTSGGTVTVPRSVAGAQSVTPPASTATAGTTRGVQGSQGITVTSGGTAALSDPAREVAGSQTVTVGHSATVTVPRNVAGSQGVALPASTSTADADLAVDAAQWLSMPASTATASAPRAVSGAQTVPAPASAAVAELSYGVSGAQTVPAPSSSAAATVRVAISGAQTQNVSQSATVAVPRSVSGAQTVPVPSQTSSGGPLAAVSGSQVVDQPGSAGSLSAPARVAGNQVVSSTQTSDIDPVARIDGTQPPIGLPSQAATATVVDAGAAVVNAAQLIAVASSGALSTVRNAAAAQTVQVVQDTDVDVVLESFSATVIPAPASVATASVRVRVTGVQALDIDQAATAGVRVRVTGVQAVSTTQVSDIQGNSGSGGNQIVRLPLQSGTISVVVKVDGAQIVPPVDNDTPPAQYSPVKLYGRGSRIMLHGTQQRVTLQGRASRRVRLP